MPINNKNIPTLRQLPRKDTSTTVKARESWHILGIMAEFIESAEKLSAIRPSVSIFGSARTPLKDPVYKLTLEIARKLSDAGFAVVSGGGPGVMEAANKGAHAGASPSVGLNIELPLSNPATLIRIYRLPFGTFSRAKWLLPNTPALTL